MLTINVDVKGVEKTKKNIGAIEKELTHWKPELKKTGEFLVEFFSKEVFESEGAVIGEPWPELSPAYMTRKVRMWPGKGILEASGFMRRGFVPLPTDTLLKITNLADYFKYHQSGASRTKLPRRVMMKVDAERKKSIIGIIKDGLMKKVRRAVF